MVHFRPMTANEFEIFAQWSVNNYAKSLIKSKLTTKRKAHTWAREEFDETFPEGIASKDNYFYVIQNEQNENVGVICYQTHPDSPEIAFITEFIIEEKFRRKGYGSSTLAKIAEDAKEKGYTKMRLNVFKHNRISYAMYLKNGYEVVEDYDGSAIMEKVL